VIIKKQKQESQGVNILTSSLKFGGLAILSRISIADSLATMKKGSGESQSRTNYSLLQEAEAMFIACLAFFLRNILSVR